MVCFRDRGEGERVGQSNGYKTYDYNIIAKRLGPFLLLERIILMQWAHTVHSHTITGQSSKKPATCKL